MNTRLTARPTNPRQGASSLVLSLALTLLAQGAHAALIDRGNGLIYDSTLNLTWQQDANLATTQTFGVAGIEANGRMTEDVAVNWIGAMNGAAYKGYSDWRLPQNTPVNGSAFTFFSSADFWTGARDVSYNITSVNSPLAHLFYADLGNLGGRTTAGVARTGTAGVDYGLLNTGPFQNMQVYGYWTGTTNTTPIGTDQGWFFSNLTGYQSQVFVDSSLYGWAVRTGDVAAVPEPASALLMLAGLAGAGLFASRRRPE